MKGEVVVRIITSNPEIPMYQRGKSRDISCRENRQIKNVHQTRTPRAVRFDQKTNYR
jgi:hypothetical protein